MLLIGEISNCGKKNGENVCFSAQDPVNEKEALACSQEPSWRKKVVWKSPWQRGLMVSSRDKCQSKWDSASPQRPGWQTPTLLVPSGAEQAQEMYPVQVQSQAEQSLSKHLATFKAFLHWRAELDVLEGSNFVVDTTGGTRSLYSWLEQGVGDVQGKLSQLVLRHALPLEFPSAGNSHWGSTTCN